MTENIRVVSLFGYLFHINDLFLDVLLDFPSCEINFGHWLQEYDGFLHVFVLRCILNLSSCEKNFGHWLQEYDVFLHVCVLRCILNLPSCEINFWHWLQEYGWQY